MLNKKECAERLGICRETLNRLIKDGEIKCYIKKANIYVKALFDEKEVEKLKKQMTRNSIKFRR